MGISDISHWRRNNSLHPSWEDRVAAMVTKIEPGSRVLDIGAGSQTLRRHLPADCEYFPLDIVARTPETIVCDLNRGTLPVMHVDYAVVSGVLEYLMDVPRFLAELALASPQVVLSYVVPHSGETVFERRAMGWVNDFTQEEIEDIFIRGGFVVNDCEQWGGQLIYWLRVNSLSQKPE